jgi:hypothetical protein
LGDAVGLGGLQGCDGDFEFERGDEIGEVGRRPGSAGALGSLRVEFAATPVLIGNASTIESPDVAQEIGNFGGAGQGQG